MKKIVLITAVIIAVIVAGIVIFGRENNTGEEKIKAGLVLNGSSNDKSWSQSHYEAMLKTAEELDLELVYRENVPEDGVADVVDEFAAEGCSIIICNSFGYGEYLDEAAAKYPEIYFLHASGVNYGGNISTYFGRMYQIRYLCGIAAGLQTETDKIGYVAAFPISEVNRGINAFTLGVRSVNPDAQVYISWTNSWVDDEASAEATRKIIENSDIDIITMHVDSVKPLEVAGENGVMCIGYNFDNSSDHPDTYLTAAVWSWENFYIPRIREYMQGKYKGENYWEGIDTGIVSLAPFTDNVKEGIAEAVEAESERLRGGTFDVFYGPVKDSDGNIRVAEGESMTDDNMLNAFDWYVEGVVADEE